MGGPDPVRIRSGAGMGWCVWRSGPALDPERCGLNLIRVPDAKQAGDPGSAVSYITLCVC